MAHHWKLKSVADVIQAGYDAIPQQAKVATDVLSLGVAGATLVKLLPPAAALASLIWTGIQIYEWWKKKRATR